jgi:signal transduction histidine kinase
VRNPASAIFGPPIGGRELRGRYLSARFLFAVVALVCGVALLEWFGEPTQALERASPGLAAAFLGSLFGQAFVKKPQMTAWAAIVVALSIVFACARIVDDVGADPVCAILALALIWAAPFVSRRQLYFVGFASWLALIAADVKWTWKTVSSGPDEYSIILTATYILIPLILATVVRLDDEAREQALHDQVQRLKQAQRELERQYQVRSEELALSRNELARVERQRGISELSSGLAHELNNLLTPIHGLAELLSRGANHEQSQRYGTSILRCAQQAATITQGLQIYARISSFAPVPTHLAAFLRHEVWTNRERESASPFFLNAHAYEHLVVNLDRRLVRGVLRYLADHVQQSSGSASTLHFEIDVEARPDAGLLPTGRERDSHDAVIRIHNLKLPLRAHEANELFDGMRFGSRTADSMEICLSTLHAVAVLHDGLVSVVSVNAGEEALELRLPTSSPLSAAAFSGPVSRQVSRRDAILFTDDDDIADELDELLDEQKIQCQVRPLKNLEDLKSDVGDDAGWLFIDSRGALPAPFLQRKEALAPGVRVVRLRDPQMHESWPEWFDRADPRFSELTLPLDQISRARLLSLLNHSLAVEKGASGSMVSPNATSQSIGSEI